MKMLTIESSCDETAAAIIAEDHSVLAAVVASQAKLHEQFGGVVPEIASRAHVERILPVIDQTLRNAGLTLADIDCVAVAHTPGLAGSLLVGVTAAKAIALARGIPLISVNHLQAHIYACRMASGENVFPCVGLIVSGGHSNIYRCLGPTDFEPLGGTIDDAAGEAFDKVASLLGLPYPGGPSIQRAAELGNRTAFALPRPLLNDRSRLEFSFSGLKTAVRYQIAGPGHVDPKSLNLDEQTVRDLAASFQEAVIDCLIGKTELALDNTGLKTLCVGGGVAANARLRVRLEQLAEERGIRLFVPPLSLCTDNAVMGAIALERYQAGLFESLDLEATPGPLRA